jgi:predicted transcriptional regulator
MADGLLRLTAEIVSSYVENNSIAVGDLGALISSTFGALDSNVGSAIAESEPVAKPTAAQIRKSIKPDVLISFVDGRPYRALKRHLGKHRMTPDEYRAQFGLPTDYPMIARSYSEKRSVIARHFGFGTNSAAPEPVAQPAAATETAESAALVAKPLKSRPAVKLKNG